MSGIAIVPTDLDSIDSIAERIRQRIRRTTADIIETGKDLRLVKERLGHGQFATWINSEFGMSPRSAQRFMGASEWAEDKSDTVSHLLPTTLYTLSAKATPELIREQVIADIEAGNQIDPREIAERVRMARGDKRLADKHAAEAERRRRRNRDREAHEKIRAEQERKRAEDESAADAIAAIMKEHLPEEQLEEIRRLLQDPRVYFHMLIGKLG